MIRIIWKKNFKKMINKMEHKMREDTLKRLLNFVTDEKVKYLKGFDDGYCCACEDILKWMEGKKKKI